MYIYIYIYVCYRRKRKKKRQGPFASATAICAGLKFMSLKVFSLSLSRAA